MTDRYKDVRGLDGADEVSVVSLTSGASLRCIAEIRGLPANHAFRTGVETDRPSALVV